MGQNRQTYSWWVFSCKMYVCLCEGRIFGMYTCSGWDMAIFCVSLIFWTLESFLLISRRIGCLRVGDYRDDSIAPFFWLESIKPFPNIFAEVRSNRLVYCWIILKLIALYKSHKLGNRGMIGKDLATFRSEAARHERRSLCGLKPIFCELDGHQRWSMTD